MRRVISLAAATAVAIALLSHPGSAVAGVNCGDGTVPGPGPDGGTVCIPAVDPGGANGNGKNVSGPGGGGSGDSRTPEAEDRTDCFLTRINPQPDADHPAWTGHTSDEGFLYFRRCHLGSDPQGVPIVFVPNGADPPPPPPDPGELARRALDVLQLETPEVHFAPAPPAKTYVGLNTWLWMPAGQWAVLNKSVTAGDTTVTVTAVPESVAWDMGTGSLRCYSPGREWKTGQMPKGSQTDCSYKYEKVSDFEPGKKFAVSSTITYQVDWVCEGECLTDEGTLGQVAGPAGGSAISVGERQSVVVSGGKS